jgi:Fe-Mn family superoxide dismutase
MKEDFTQAGVTQFGLWLGMARGQGRKLIVSKTPNGENPLVHGATPPRWRRMGAFLYIDYRNRRPDISRS